MITKTKAKGKKNTRNKDNRQGQNTKSSQQAVKVVREHIEKFISSLGGYVSPRKTNEFIVRLSLDPQNLRNVMVNAFHAGNDISVPTAAQSGSRSSSVSIINLSLEKLISSDTIRGAKSTGCVLPICVKIRSTCAERWRNDAVSAVMVEKVFIAKQEKRCQIIKKAAKQFIGRPPSRAAVGSDAYVFDVDVPYYAEKIKPYMGLWVWYEDPQDKGNISAEGRWKRIVSSPVNCDFVDEREIDSGFEWSERYLRGCHSLLLGSSRPLFVSSIVEMADLIYDRYLMEKKNKWRL